MIFALFAAVSAANRSMYRTCAESMFCTRDRAVPKQLWSLDPKSVISNSRFEATIKDGTYASELRLKIEFLVCGAVRLRIEPIAKETFNRFDLSKEPTVIQPQRLDALAAFEKEESPEKVVLKRGNLRAEVVFAPFSVVIFDGNEKKMTINPDDTAVFETGRDRSKFESLFENNDWQGFNDTFRNGPTSVAMDVEFHSPGVRMSGLPSHTLPLTLKQTVGVSDPIRFFKRFGTKVFSKL